MFLSFKFKYLYLHNLKLVSVSQQGSPPSGAWNICHSSTIQCHLTIKL